jgi:hypothetical protein
LKGIISAWGKILTGFQPNLLIEITRECPLVCPGCCAYVVALDLSPAITMLIITAQ